MKQDCVYIVLQIKSAKFCGIINRSVRFSCIWIANQCVLCYIALNRMIVH